MALSGPSSYPCLVWPGRLHRAPALTFPKMLGWCGSHGDPKLQGMGVQCPGSSAACVDRVTWELLRPHNQAAVGIVSVVLLIRQPPSRPAHLPSSARRRRAAEKEKVLPCLCTWAWALQMR